MRSTTGTMTNDSVPNLLSPMALPPRLAARPHTLPLAMAIYMLGACIFSDAYAGAWVKDPGDGLALATLNWYESDRYWDENSKLKDAPKYRKLGLNPLVEYGFTPEFTAGFSAFLNQVETVTNGRSTGIGDVEIFGRRRLWQGGRGVASTQVLVKIPELGGHHSPALGGDQYDLEARLLYGRSGQWNPGGGSEWYFNVETGVRKRYGSPADEFRLDWLYGWRSSSKLWEVELKQSNMVALQRRDAGDFVWTDYDLYKLSTDARYWLAHDWAIEMGVSYDIAGRKVGQGISPFVALWRTF